MINYIKNVWNKFMQKKEDVVGESQKQDLSQYDNLGDHIVLCLTKENEPYIKMMVIDDDDINRVTHFADMLDSLNNGLYFSSMLQTLQDIGQNNPQVAQKVSDIIYCWKELHGTRNKNRKTLNKNLPVIRPTSFSKDQTQGQ